MGNFSRDTFDERKHYASVRLQQGVPLVDADWNEKEDIRRDELRRFTRAFVGSGVPLGSDGFRILTSSVWNDFEISAGRCLVDGWEVVNDWDERDDDVGRFYTSQPLFGDDGLAAAWGVDPLPPLTRARSARTDRVYLDVWEREVDADEDPDLVDPQLGVEGCVRVRREWVVRVAEGAEELPSPPAGHAFYELAVLHRNSKSGLTSTQVVDRRRTGLSAVSQNHISQITSDAFGPGYTLDGDGRPNLKVSLRDAINALMRGQLPGTPPLPVTQVMGSDSLGGPRSVLADREGGVWAFWISSRNGERVWCNRFDPAVGGWTGDQPLAESGGFQDQGPITAVEDTDGSIWIFWSRTPSNGNSQIMFDRFDRASGKWRGARQVTTGDAGSDTAPTAVVDGRGTLWVLWSRGPASASVLCYTRFDRNSGKWTGEFQFTGGSDSAPTAVVDGSDNLWVFWSRSSTLGNLSVRCNRYDLAQGKWVGETGLTDGTSSSLDAVAVLDGDRVPWVFWTSTRNGNADVYFRRWDRVGGSWEAERRLTTDAGQDSEVAALAGDGGDLWVFWSNRPGGSARPRVLCRRYTRDGGWGNTIQVSPGPASGFKPAATRDREGDIWIFWTHITGSNPTDIWYRRLVTAL